jgi:hypothetical protein
MKSVGNAVGRRRGYRPSPGRNKPVFDSANFLRMNDNEPIMKKDIPGGNSLANWSPNGE